MRDSLAWKLDPVVATVVLELKEKEKLIIKTHDYKHIYWYILNLLSIIKELRKSYFLIILRYYKEGSIVLYSNK